MRSSSNSSFADTFKESNRLNSQSSIKKLVESQDFSLDEVDLKPARRHTTVNFAAPNFMSQGITDRSSLKVPPTLVMEKIDSVNKKNDEPFSPARSQRSVKFFDSSRM